MTDRVVIESSKINKMFANKNFSGNFVSPIPSHVYNAIGMTGITSGGTGTSGNVSIGGMTQTETQKEPVVVTPPRTIVDVNLNVGDAYMVGPMTEWEVPDTSETMGKGFVWTDTVHNGNRVIMAVLPGAGYIPTYHIDPKGGILEQRDLKIIVANPEQQPDSGLTPGNLINNPPGDTGSTGGTGGSGTSGRSGGDSGTDTSGQTAGGTGTGVTDTGQTQTPSEPVISTPSIPSEPALQVAPGTSTPDLPDIANQKNPYSDEDETSKRGKKIRNYMIGSGIVGALVLGIIAFFAFKKKRGK